MIFGFPRCGTTILRNIIGHCDDVFQIVKETDKIDTISHNKKFGLCKFI